MNIFSMERIVKDKMIHLSFFLGARNNMVVRYLTPRSSMSSKSRALGF